MRLAKASVCITDWPAGGRIAGDPVFGIRSDGYTDVKKEFADREPTGPLRTPMRKTGRNAVGAVAVIALALTLPVPLIVA